MAADFESRKQRFCLNLAVGGVMTGLVLLSTWQVSTAAFSQEAIGVTTKFQATSKGRQLTRLKQEEWIRLMK